MLEREEVLKLAKLSRLEVAESDIESVKGHLDKMLNHLVIMEYGLNQIHLVVEIL